MSKNDHTWELINAVLLAGLAIRAVAGLLMVGDLAVAGQRMLVATGLLLCLFGLLEGGLSLESMQHTIPGLVIAGLGVAARARPRAVSTMVLTLIAGLVALLATQLWGRDGVPTLGAVFALSLIFSPMALAAICLWRSSRASDTEAPGRAAIMLLVAVGLAALVPARAESQAKPMTCGPWGGDKVRGTYCLLKRDTTMLGHPLVAGTHVLFDSAGALRIIVLAKDANFNGLLLKGSGDGPHHVLYADGTPKMLWLARTQDVQGVPCRPISFFTEIIRHTSAVHFHPSGRLRACRLGRDANIQGRTFASGDPIEFDSAGTLLLARP
jgi:hypothetical protein